MMMDEYKAGTRRDRDIAPVIHGLPSRYNATTNDE